MPKIKRFDTIRFDYPADPVGFDINDGYEKDPLGGWIEIQYVNEGERQKIIQRAYPVKVMFAKGGNVTQEGALDRIVDREETAVAYISSWGNFYDGEGTEKNPNGKELKCTDANKREFSREDGFMTALNRMIVRANAIFAEQQDASEKN